MEPNTIPPPGQSVQPGVVSNPGTTLPVSSYAGGQKSYPLETLEVHRQGQAQAAQTFAPTMRSVPFSRRRATVVSLFITLIVILITGLVSAFFVNRSAPDRSASQLDVPTQDTSLEGIIESDLPAELQGLENSLLVSGDIVTRGKLRVASGSFISTFGSADLTANRAITLPDASGVVCLDANNCNFATQAQLAQIQPASVIDLDSSDVTDTLPVIRGGTGATALTANGLLIGSGTNPITAVSAAGSGLCLISTGSAPAFQTCPGGGASGVSSLNSLTGGLTLQGTANQINVASGGITITLSTPQDIATTSNVTFNNLQLTGTADVDGIAAIGNGSDISSGVPDPDGKTALRVTNTFLTDCAFGCVGVASHVEFDAPGNPFFLTAFSGSIFVEDSRGLANSSGLTISNPGLGTGATVQQNTGILVNPQTSGNSNIGIVVGEATGTKQINLLLGITPDFSWSNVPSGSYSIYNASTDNNYFAGNLGIGDTTPAYALTVGTGDLFGVNSSGNVIVTALGTASTDTVVCRNGSNQLATCNSTFATGSGTAFLQGGNNFGGTTAGNLGTINNGDLNIISTNLTRLTVQADGDIVLDPGTDPTLFVDAANNRVALGTTGPSSKLHVQQGDRLETEGIRIQDSDSSAPITLFYDVGGVPTIQLGGNYKVGHFSGSTSTGELNAGRLLNIKSFNESTLGGISFDLNGTELARFHSNGNFGIGDTTPVATFTVGSGDLFQVAGATGNATTAGDVAVNGGDITSTAATLNINAGTTINLQDVTTITNGSAGSPALAFNSDTNTGIYHADTTDGDQIGFTTGGVNTVTIGADPGAAAFTSGTLRIAITDINVSEEFEIWGQGTEDFDIATGRGLGIFMNETTTGGPFIVWSDGNDIFNLSSGGNITTEPGAVTFLQGFLRLGVDAVSRTDGQEIIPGSSFVEVTCTTGGGCTLTMDEDFSSRGQTVRIVNVGANTVTINNTSGNVELAGSAAWAGTQWSSLSLIYVVADGATGRWVELARSVH